MNPRRGPDLNFLAESSLQSLKFKDTISALLLYELAVKYAVIFARICCAFPGGFSTLRNTSDCLTVCSGFAL